MKAILAGEIRVRTLLPAYRPKEKWGMGNVEGRVTRKWAIESELHVAVARLFLVVPLLAAHLFPHLFAFSFR